MSGKTPAVITRIDMTSEQLCIEMEKEVLRLAEWHYNAKEDPYGINNALYIAMMELENAFHRARTGKDKTP